MTATSTSGGFLGSRGRAGLLASTLVAGSVLALSAVAQTYSPGGGQPNPYQQDQYSEGPGRPRGYPGGPYLQGTYAGKPDQEDGYSQGLNQGQARPSQQTVDPQSPYQQDPIRRGEYQQGDDQPGSDSQGPYQEDGPRSYPGQQGGSQPDAAPYYPGHRHWSSQIGGSAAPCPPSPVSERYPSLAAVLEPIRLKHNLPALGAAIVTPQGVESLGVVGVKRFGEPAPACIEDAFQLGSETKAFTATVLARLIEGGRLSWNSTISAVFSDLPQHPAWANITLEQLLAHQAGLPRIPAPRPFLSSLNGPIRQQRNELARIVLARPPQFEPGTFHYSNTGYFLAGVMAERAAGKPWEELVREIIFGPLQMARAGFGPTAPANGLGDHQFGPAGFPVHQLYRGPVAVVGPAGTIHASMEDWGKFIADMLRGFGGGGSLLAPQTYQRLHKAPLGGTYANGWIVGSRPWAGGPVFFHTGTTTQDLAIAWVAPRKGIAILVATNIGMKAKDACFEVKDALLAQRLGIKGPAELSETEKDEE